MTTRELIEKLNEADPTGDYIVAVSCEPSGWPWSHELSSYIMQQDTKPDDNRRKRSKRTLVLSLAYDQRIDTKWFKR